MVDVRVFRQTIDGILNQRVFAVAGVSRNHEKYGYKVYQTLKRFGYRVYAMNPNADEIDGDTVYPLLDNIPEQVDCLVTVVPPEATHDLVRRAGQLRVPYVWMQPGSESESAVIEAQAWGMQAVYGGPCIMVAATTRSAVRATA